MTSRKRVFCSHCAPDHVAVKAFAAKLAARGIDAWCNEWELLPGDDVVARLNEGLDECDAGLFFFSKDHTHADGLDEGLAELLRRRPERMISVVLDADAKLPSALLGTATRTIDEVDAIVETIAGG
jgi:hypothetical protein